MTFGLGLEGLRGRVNVRALKSSGQEANKQMSKVVVAKMAPFGSPPLPPQKTKLSMGQVSASPRHEAHARTRKRNSLSIGMGPNKGFEGWRPKKQFLVFRTLPDSCNPPRIHQSCRS